MKKLKFSLLALFLASNLSALTLTGLRSDVRLLVNDASSTSRQRFTSSSIDAWLNEGQRIADIRSLCNYKSYSFELVADTTYYAMPADFLQPIRVLRKNLELYEMTPAALDSRSSEWESSEGTPVYYFINFSSRSSTSAIGFAPFPGTSSDTGTVKVDYIAYSTEMTSDSDVPFNGNSTLYPFHYALAYYAAYKISVVDERLPLAEIYLKQFEAMVALMKDRCIERPNYRPGLVGRNK